VALGNIDALYEWAESDEELLYSVFRRVELWIAGLASTPWQQPSVPLTLAAGEPWEIRSAVVPGTDGVEVFYEHEHATGAVNVLRVIPSGPGDSNHPPPGLTFVAERFAGIYQI
jgi:hypothetical protein